MPRYRLPLRLGFLLPVLLASPGCDRAKPPAANPPGAPGIDAEEPSAPEPQVPEKNDVADEEQSSPSAKPSPLTVEAPAETIQAAEPPELKVVDLRAGAGEPVENGDEVSIHFTGTLLDGTTWSQSQSGEPRRLRVGDESMIRGLSQGLVGMKPGGARRLTVPAPLGYGQRGLKDPATGRYLVPPGATLLLEVQLVEKSSPTPEKKETE